jgi:hypothetical protein
MRRTEVLQEIRRMRFEEAYVGWSEDRLMQAQAAEILEGCDRTFRRYIHRYEDLGIEGLSDKRLSQASCQSQGAGPQISGWLPGRLSRSEKTG